MAESGFFSFHAVQIQEVSYFKIEPRCNVTMHVQSHELHHGCSNDVVGNRKLFSKVWRSIYWHFKVVGQIYLVEWRLMLTV